MNDEPVGATPGGICVDEAGSSSKTVTPTPIRISADLKTPPIRSVWHGRPGSWQLLQLTHTGCIAYHDHGRNDATETIVTHTYSSVFNFGASVQGGIFISHLAEEYRDPKTGQNFQFSSQQTAVVGGENPNNGAANIWFPAWLWLDAARQSSASHCSSDLGLDAKY